MAAVVLKRTSVTFYRVAFDLLREPTCRSGHGLVVPNEGSAVILDLYPLTLVDYCCVTFSFKDGTVSEFAVVFSGSIIALTEYIYIPNLTLTVYIYMHLTHLMPVMA